MLEQATIGSRRREMSALTGARPADTRADLLPGADDDGFFGIRFESIGGLWPISPGGSAEAGVLRQGLNGAHFSSYGSRRRHAGEAVRALLPPTARSARAARSRSPQVVAVFHEALACSFDVAAGLSPTAR
jgi:pyruvate ferredoxin oxidoreductase gamma subunit